MAGSMSWIEDNDDSWPSDEGWPYSDRGPSEVVRGREDGGDEPDDDLVSLHAAAPHLFDDLDPIERQVVTARFGLDGSPARSLKQIQRELGVPHDDLRNAFADGIAKLRRHLR
jgi:DNA-directed RNA polymerase sigma subunit (sigma70/sigma32)